MADIEGALALDIPLLLFLRAQKLIQADESVSRERMVELLNEVDPELLVVDSDNTTVETPYKDGVPAPKTLPHYHSLRESSERP